MRVSKRDPTHVALRDVAGGPEKRGLDSYFVDCGRGTADPVSQSEYSILSSAHDHADFCRPCDWHGIRTFISDWYGGALPTARCPRSTGIFRYAGAGNWLGLHGGTNGRLPPRIHRGLGYRWSVGSTRLGPEFCNDISVHDFGHACRLYLRVYVARGTDRRGEGMDVWCATIPGRRRLQNTSRGSGPAHGMAVG